MVAQARRGIDRYLGAVPPVQRNTVASFLPILVAQGLLLLPVAAGAVSSLDYGVVLSAVSGALFAGVAFLMIRNLVRLWRVRSRQVGVGSLIALVLAARHAIRYRADRRARSGDPGSQPGRPALRSARPRTTGSWSTLNR